MRDVDENCAPVNAGFVIGPTARTVEQRMALGLPPPETPPEPAPAPPAPPTAEKMQQQFVQQLQFLRQESEQLALDFDTRRRREKTPPQHRTFVRRPMRMARSRQRRSTTTRTTTGTSARRARASGDSGDGDGSSDGPGIRATLAQNPSLVAGGAK